MDRIQKEENESQLLHSAASRSADSAGRAFTEQTDKWRTRYERDRDRIIHCSAFRRLMYKTQVFVNHVGDNQRTRLTHSLEVMQVSRSLANVLDLNESLCESIALAHDLGHPPFGHSGEALLADKMKEHGGFAHNKQSLRIVDVLERRSPEYRGLNLTEETKSCLKKHEENIDPATGNKLCFPRLEAQLVDLADSTAYHYHDIDDGIREKILDPVKMEGDLEIWAIAIEESRSRHSNQSDGVLLWRRAANEILGMAIADISEESRQRLQSANGMSALEAQANESRLIGHSPKFKTMVAEMHKYLYENMYFNEEINWQIRRSTELLEKVFDGILESPEHIPARFLETAESTERAACDFVSGMTDRYVDTIARTLNILPAY
jgi:dGTPase